jgi:protein-L-isoaspartate O-methyltransferase
MRGAPGPLLAQLVPGGRFVMPLGADRWAQRLICRTRTGPDAYMEGGVRVVAFVPLVGAHGWPTDATPRCPKDPLNHRKEG